MQKGPYFQPVQYISPVPEGYAQAGANIGRSIGGGLAALGAGVSEGIDKYYKSEEERQALGGTISRYFKSDPKLAETVDQKLLEKYTSGKATLADHKALFADISTEQMLQQKKLQTETAQLANQRSQAELGYLKSKENDNKILRDAMAMNTDTDGNLDLPSALQTYSEMNGNIANNDILAGLKNVQNINFGSEPKIKTLTGESGQSVDVLQAGPGNATIIPREKPATLAPAESAVGKMVADRNRISASGDKAAAEAIQRQIDAETNQQPKLQAADQTFIQNIKEYQNQLSSLKKTIKEHGTFESATFGNPAAASALDQLPYKMAITYSKLVDPQSVAREGEVEAAKKYIVPLGLMANKKQALASIDAQEKEVNRRATEFAKVKGIKLEDLLVQEALPPVVAPVTVKASSGLNYTVTRDPAKKNP